MDTDAKLACVLGEFARMVVTDFPVQAILDQLVLQIVDVLPVSAAGVTLISEGSAPRYVAASDEAAVGFEQLQVDLAEGPCIDAYASGEAVAVPCLRKERRFPRFTPRALDQGLEAVFTFPLHRTAGRLGALDVYSDHAGALDGAEMTAAQTVADVTAAYLLNAEARRQLDEATERASRNSLHDALTGLPNRTLLLERVGQAVLRARRTGRSTAVFVVDLDLFRLVNDCYGRVVGDHLLVAVADRLTGQLRASDTVARLTGDEFVIVCEDLAESEDVALIAARLDLALAQRFVLAGAEVKITASIGIASTDGDGTAEQVLQEAHAAAAQAKAHGGARCVRAAVERHEPTAPTLVRGLIG